MPHIQDHYPGIHNSLNFRGHDYGNDIGWANEYEAAPLVDFEIESYRWDIDPKELLEVYSCGDSSVVGTPTVAPLPSSFTCGLIILVVVFVRYRFWNKRQKAL